MAIIRNERPRRQEPEPPAASQSEEEIDYRWHPTEDEFVSPLTAKQWAELLGDATFAQTDAANAVRCLRDYGEPATFQQLSIRYRGTMGRYRRWLGEAAQHAGERFGVEAPSKDQFGMDEWWQLLYVTRATGKPGAGVFEMQLRPEVEQAFDLIAEQERQAKRAENARQLQRIEQLERARKEERERLAAKAAKAQSAEEQEAVAPAAMASESEAPAQAPVQDGASQADAPSPDRTLLASDAVPSAAFAEEPIPTFPALNEFLEVVGSTQDAGGSRYVALAEHGDVVPFDATGPIDYALRYAERLRGVLAIMRAGAPGLTAAGIAREVGDGSVELLQDVLNGQRIPTFPYLDALKERLFVNPAHLEAPEGSEDSVPAFCTYAELLNERGARADLGKDLPREIAYVVDDSPDRRTGVVLRFSALRCTLLSRVSVRAEAKRSESDELNAFVRMVDELDDFARREGIARTSRTVGAADWEKVVAGKAWAGTLL